MPDDAPLSLDFVPPLSFGPGPSFVLDVALLGLALGALLIGLAVHARRLARARAREREQLGEDSPLRAGAYAVLEGNIDSREPGPPVQVTLTETRTDVRSSRPRPTARQVVARPFDLETATGTVRVEPGTDLLVAAELDIEERSLTAHVRRAELQHGNRVIVYGTLTRERHAFAGYRGGAEGWTLRAPRGGRLLLADAALATRYDARIRLLRAFTGFAIPLWLVFHAVCTSAFLYASFAGTQTSTQLLDRQDEEPTFGPIPHGRNYLLHTVTQDGLALDSRVDAHTGEALFAANAKAVPLLRTRFRSACYVGGEAWTSVPAVGGGLLVAVVLLSLVRQRYRHATPWYDRA